MTQGNPVTPPIEGQAPAAESQPAPEAKKAEGEKQASGDPAPMTREEFAAKRDELFARARAVGLRPFQEVTLDIARRALAALDGFLTGLEGKEPPRKKG